MTASDPSKRHLQACVKRAKAEGYEDLVVGTKGRRVILSGIVEGSLCHACTVSQHRTPEKAHEQSIKCQRWLRDALPGERAPQLAGQCVLMIDTGIATSKTVISRTNKHGENNADVFLKEAMHFGIMRHGVTGLVAMLLEMAADPKYAKFQDAGLRQ